MRKIHILIIASLVLGTIGTYIAFHKDTTSSVLTPRTAIVTKSITSVQTYEECLNTSEAKYRAYILAHGTTGTNQYGQPIFIMAQAGWDKINADRAAEYSVCFQSHKGEFPTLP